MPHLFIQSLWPEPPLTTWQKCPGVWMGGEERKREQGPGGQGLGGVWFHRGTTSYFPANEGAAFEPLFQKQRN